MDGLSWTRPGSGLVEARVSWPGHPWLTYPKQERKGKRTFFYGKGNNIWTLLLDKFTVLLEELPCTFSLDLIHYFNGSRTSTCIKLSSIDWTITFPSLYAWKKGKLQRQESPLLLNHCTTNTRYSWNATSNLQICKVRRWVDPACQLRRSSSMADGRLKSGGMLPETSPSCPKTQWSVTIKVKNRGGT